MPRPFGQHFLRYEPAHDLVDLIDPRPEDTFLEIGPGALAITSLLASRCRSVTAIEIDRRLVDDLRGQVPSNVTIIRGDALELDYRTLVPPGSRLAGNLPYAISSPLLRRFLEHRDHFTDAHLMLQKEVAERVASPPGSKAYGILSVLYALWADVSIVQRLKPHDFSLQRAVRRRVKRGERRVHRKGLRLRDEREQRRIAGDARAGRRRRGRRLAGLRRVGRGSRRDDRRAGLTRAGCEHGQPHRDDKGQRLMTHTPCLDAESERQVSRYRVDLDGSAVLS